MGLWSRQRCVCGRRACALAASRLNAKERPCNCARATLVAMKCSTRVASVSGGSEGCCVCRCVHVLSICGNVYVCTLKYACKQIQASRARAHLFVCSHTRAHTHTHIHTHTFTSLSIPFMPLYACRCQGCLKCARS